ncbi:uncharacterized protein LOC132272446 [Cornus florida]|uniref:uncharacterized protein LOC132272446 n=1 Tax=Cornus florida TaxID=4283 RepID=UPI0028982484|nr:uncharacterized protein LOC132272446 [Cornus florida]
MAPFEALYDRPCRSPICWTEVGDTIALGPDIVIKTTDKIKLIRQQLATAQSRQRSYTDRRRRLLSFEVGDHVFLKISPRKGLLRFQQTDLDRVHDIFHVSTLRKYKPDPSYVLQWTDVVVREDVTYEKGLVQILDSWEQVLRTKNIPLVKVLWRHHSVEEAT